MKNETMSNGANEQVNEQTAVTISEQTAEKASAILRARLPKLSAENLNFEKRTGNFFKASMMTDENGDEKLRRLVVEDANINPECADEMQVKRAAAFVQQYEGKTEQADRAVKEAQQALKEAQEYRKQLDADLSDAVALVEGYELPEKDARTTKAETIAKQADEIARLKAMLAAAGIEC